MSDSSRYCIYCLLNLFSHTIAGSAAAKSSQATDLPDDDSEDEDFIGGEEEDIDLEEELDSDEVDSIVNDLEEDEMAPSSAKKRTPRKAATKAQEATKAELAQVTSSLNQLKVSSSYQSFSVNQQYPFIVSTYEEGDDTMCDVYFLAPTLPKEFFLPEVTKGGSALGLSTRLPNFFRRHARILKANKDKEGFNADTSQAQGFKKVCDSIDAHYGLKDVIYSDPQEVTLPFNVEETIVVWEIQASLNNLGKLTDDLGGQQFFYVIYVKLRKLKEKKRTAGAFRIIDDVGEDGMEEDL